MTAAAPVAVPAGIVGSWRNASGYARFNADGTGVVDGESGRYEIQGNQLTLIGAKGRLTVPFELEGDRLTITVNGAPVTLEARARSGGHGRRAAGTGGQVVLDFGGDGAAGGADIEPVLRVERERHVSVRRGRPTVTTRTAGRLRNRAMRGVWTATQTTLTAVSRTRGTKVYRMELRNHPKNGDPNDCAGRAAVRHLFPEESVVKYGSPGEGCFSRCSRYRPPGVLRRLTGYLLASSTPGPHAAIVLPARARGGIRRAFPAGSYSEADGASAGCLRGAGRVPGLRHGRGEGRVSRLCSNPDAAGGGG